MMMTLLGLTVIVTQKSQVSLVFLAALLPSLSSSYLLLALLCVIILPVKLKKQHFFFCMYSNAAYYHRIQPGAHPSIHSSTSLLTIHSISISYTNLSLKKKPRKIFYSCYVVSCEIFFYTFRILQDRFTSVTPCISKKNYNTFKVKPKE